MEIILSFCVLLGAGISHFVHGDKPKQKTNDSRHIQKVK